MNHRPSHRQRLTAALAGAAANLPLAGATASLPLAAAAQDGKRWKDTP